MQEHTRLGVSSVPASVQTRLFSTSGSSPVRNTINSCREFQQEGLILHLEKDFLLPPPSLFSGKSICSSLWNYLLTVVFSPATLVGGQQSPICGGEQILINAFYSLMDILWLKHNRTPLRCWLERTSLIPPQKLIRDWVYRLPCMKAFYFHPWENHFRPLSLKCPFYLPKFCSERTASKDLPNINNLGVLLTSS